MSKTKGISFSLYEYVLPNSFVGKILNFGLGLMYIIILKLSYFHNNLSVSFHIWLMIMLLDCPYDRGMKTLNLINMHSLILANRACKHEITRPVQWIHKPECVLIVLNVSYCFWWWYEVMHINEWVWLNVKILKVSYFNNHLSVSNDCNSPH